MKKLLAIIMAFAFVMGGFSAIASANDTGTTVAKGKKTCCAEYSKVKRCAKYKKDKKGKKTCAKMTKKCIKKKPCKKKA